MRVATYIIMSLALTCFIFTNTDGAGTEAEAPSYGSLDVNTGLMLFNDYNLGEGTSGKSCNSCHPDGRGLETSGKKETFNIFGKKQNGLKEAVNFCIVNALKGTAIDPDSGDMKSIVSYIKSLKK